MADFPMDVTYEIKLDPRWREVGGKIQAAVQLAAFNVEKRAKKHLTDKGAVDTGTLRGSIAAVPVGMTLGGESLDWRIGTHIEYAPFVEFGTYKMEARTFLVPALDTEHKHLRNAVNQILSELVRG